MTDYVVGFLITHSRDRVVLIHKRRPEWQAGKLNGVGGHVEDGELPGVAMQREFKEETGLETPIWDHFLTLVSGRDNIYFFRMFAGLGDLISVKSMTDEAVGTYSLPPPAAISDMYVPNLQWILPLAVHQKNKYSPITVYELV